MQQLDLFNVPQDMRNANLRSFIKHEWAGKFKLMDIKTIFSLAEKFGVIEGRVLAIVEEEKSLWLKNKRDFNDETDEEFDEEYEEDEEDFDKEILSIRNTACKNK